MIALLLAELRDWREKRLTKTAILSVLVLCVPALIGPLNPLLLSIAVTAVCMVYGWTEGNRYKPSLSSRRLLLAFPRRPFEIVAGKILAGFLVWASLILILSPVLVASSIAWGVGARETLSSLLCWLVAFMTANAAGFVSSLAFAGSEGLAGLLAYVLWGGSSLLVDALKPSNPLVQIWNIMKAQSLTATFIGLGLDLLGALIFSVLAALVLGGGRRAHA